jgi:hypothetical protein
MTEMSALAGAAVAAGTADAGRAMLRHTVATLAYRLEKVLRDPPLGFADLRVDGGTRTPGELLAHIGDLLDWGRHLADGAWRWAPRPRGAWAADVARAFAGLAALDARLAAPEPLGHAAETIFQGPVADALTHVGQLALLRRLAGAPVRPESYARAAIAVGRVGPDQSAVRTEFDGDASRPAGAGPAEATTG